MYSLYNNISIYTYYFIYLERLIVFMKKFIYIVIGLLSFALGAIGIILPILPTTPFLLLASFCFVRSSDRINRWFTGTSIYKKHLESFVTDRSMTKKQKLLIPGFATLMILIPFILVDNLMMRMTLILIVAIKWYYFTFKIKTRTN